MQLQQRDSDSPPTIANGTNGIVDSGETVSTTDIIPYSAIGQLIEPGRATALPIHEEQLLQFTVSEREVITNAYYGLQPKSFKAYNGRTVKVHGIALYEQPGGWTDRTGIWHTEGYFQVLILLEDDQVKGEPLVCVKSSGAKLARQVYHIINSRGWFLFAEPVWYYLECGEDNSHRMFNKDLDVKSLLQDKKGKPHD